VSGGLAAMAFSFGRLGEPGAAMLRPYKEMWLY